MQSPQCVFLVRPDHFEFNAETASTNAFQKDEVKMDGAQAMEEFNALVMILQNEEIDHIVFHSLKDVYTPDAVFPNNWISIMPDGKLILYPMLTPTRQMERNPEIIAYLQKHFVIKEVIDLSPYEEKSIALEGTGSIVFDYSEKIAYACISPRTDEKLLKLLCERIAYRSMVFEAIGPKGEQIYHTNVVMNIGEKYAVICLEAIPDPVEAQMLRKSLENSGKRIIEISFAQMNSFAGNMLEVRNKKNESVLLMSDTAYQSLLPEQIKLLSQFTKIVHSPIPTIEKLGGGSVRCMLAGIQIPQKG